MRKILLFAFFALVAFGCSSSDGGDNPSDTFDRSAMLTHWADNIIIPSYENYQAKVNTLATAAAAFNANPSQLNLETLRASWLDGYKAFQYVMLYDIGKAQDLNLKLSGNTYPASATGIEANIASGNYNLTTFSQFDKQGFPAVDYLINGLGNNDPEILAFYTTNANAVKYKQYLTDVTTRLKTVIDAVVADWNGGFRDSFVASNGNSVSSSTNKITNLFVKTLEKDIRYGKLGIPSGLFSNGTTFPEKVEAYYKNDISRNLLNESLHAEQDFFNGKSFGNATTGPGLKTYLDHVNAVRNGQNLSTIINNQFTAVFEANTTLDESFSEQIFSDNTKMINAYNVLQQQVVYVKLDMLQALNITIDYVDGDGD
ncbi:imelysin family protein [Flavobacterium sp. MAH-1]|uniref:Imelysin family protein n=1 Tax=Flavobacterium agri TaxID=2743471 RepID=A0A7Y8Y3T0_9FLAO|nr:imelysin family protein [Flavobacterium agri]NUY82050.1 imelysin family protein [Flavobacterium agri]NYA72074.1 imelysin family protein [Flavobacterium agri]